MIRTLNVNNVALIESAELQLDGGFTAITGETGAGKSLLIDSLLLALGGRADTCIVRAGSSKATITLLVDIKENESAIALATELGIEIQDDELLIQREIFAEGRSAVRINGKPTTVSILRTLGSVIADLHSQHDHQNLLDTNKQLELYDEWIGEPVQNLKRDLVEQIGRVNSLESELKNYLTAGRDRAQRIDLLDFQIAEIVEANLVTQESFHLRAQLARLVNAQKLGDSLSLLVDALADSDGSAIERISEGTRILTTLSQIDTTLEPTLELLETAESALQESLQQIRVSIENLDYNPELIEVTAQRLDQIQRLKNKYGDSEDEILTYLGQAKGELEFLLSQSLDADELNHQLHIEKEKLQSIANSISLIRKQKAREFGDQTMQHLRELDLKHSNFCLKFDSKAIDCSGQESIDFLFTANNGEQLQSIHKIASGGELSRVMLAIKVSSANSQGIPTLIFDEVDTGLSGRAAAITAKKLQELALNNQVIVISHLPQVAAAADHHIDIEKTTNKNDTTTQLTKLGPHDRPKAIARLLAGEHIGESALANAQEILQAAKRPTEFLGLTG